MSAIASVMLQLGMTVTGSDRGNSHVLERLENQGARIWRDHDPRHVAGADYVVVSTAIPNDNPELEAARAQGIDILPRAKALGMLMEDKKGIAIAGSHGKSTTTSMIGTVLALNGLQPTVIAGAEDILTGENGRLGRGEHLVAEADESDGSLVHLRPYYAVITNIDNDHLDFYRTEEQIQATFLKFLQGTKKEGKAFLCGDDPGVQRVMDRWSGEKVLYGQGTNNDWQLRGWRPTNRGSEFSVYYRDHSLGTINLSVPGRHNALNALAAIAVGCEVGIPFADVQRALAKFRGTRRRFELLAEVAGIHIYDDYAHHPNEIQATLSAARSLEPRRLLVIFQPHRYSRTAQLYKEFAHSFTEADRLWLTDVYSAGEKPIAGVDAKLIVQEMTSEMRARTTHGYDWERLLANVLSEVCPGDMVLVVGAGDIRKLGEQLAGALHERPPQY